MATIEERVTALERGHVRLEKSLDLYAVALGALVDRGKLKEVNEKNEKVFGELRAQNDFTNVQLTELNGKVVGLQTEMRQRFEQIEARFTQQEAALAALNARFDRQEAAIEARFTQQEAALAALNARFDQVMHVLTALAPISDPLPGC